MINNLTHSIQATCSRTWIFAFTIDTSKVRRTIRVQNAFRSATLIRISNIITDTSASTSAILFSTYSVLPTRSRNAWLQSFGYDIGCNFQNLLPLIIENFSSVRYIMPTHFSLWVNSVRKVLLSLFNSYFCM